MIESKNILEIGGIPPAKPNIQQRISVYTDGILSESTHQSAWGLCIKIENEPVYTKMGQLPNDTNDVACRYQALYEALTSLTPTDRFMDHVTFYSDNKYLTLTMTRHYAPPTNQEIRTLWYECARLSAPFFNLKYIWVTKPENVQIRRILVEYLVKNRNGVTV